MVMQSVQNVMAYLREKGLKQQPAQFRAAIYSSFCGEHVGNGEGKLLKNLLISTLQRKHAQIDVAC